MQKKIGHALVVGAGISGIRSALDLAETGYGVTLIDRAPHIGGILTQLDDQFPSNHCGMCRMLPLARRDAGSQFCLRKGLFHENINILTSTTLTDVAGEPGHFQVRLHQTPSWVDPQLCIGCGLCRDVCPVEVPDAFNEGLSKRKAIYLPVPHTIPNPYIIDLAACTRCGECEKICPTDAIRLVDDRRRQFRILVVDDELSVRDSLKEWLEEEGFSVAMAASGPEALQMLAVEPFQLMLTDIKMPEMDGVELLKRAREANPDLCILMMTAYATVETAVEAMQIGALDYLIKPFEPDVMIPKILQVYQDLETSRDQKLAVGAIVLSGGTDYFDPSQGKNVYGYGVYPGVVTSLEFERILSGSGPFGGRLVRPKDGKPVRKIAWLQCVGSRDMQSEADFCSSVCCMYAIKEALLAKANGGDEVETVLYYMDMRTFGKSFQRYRDRAEQQHGVRFERGRIHSVTADSDTGDLVVHNVRIDGQMLRENFDLAVLSVGQRPAPGTEKLAEMADLTLNPWGFICNQPFALTHTTRAGVVLSGSCNSLKDIADSVIQASAAAMNASLTIHGAGGSLATQTEPLALRDVSREPPRIFIALCACGERYAAQVDMQTLAQVLAADSGVQQVELFEQVCTGTGWDALTERVTINAPNRLVIAACHPYLFLKKLRILARQTQLDANLMDVVDMELARSSRAASNGRQPSDAQQAEALNETLTSEVLAKIRMAAARLRRMDPAPAPDLPIVQRALVVGGGIAGMTAALSIAGHGFPVDLVEAEESLGGNLKWLQRTIDDQDPQQLLTETTQKVNQHPQIELHTCSRVVGSYGQVGNFHTTLEDEKRQSQTITHGVTILATGGNEAPTTLYCYGESNAVVTQKELEQRLGQNEIDPQKLSSVVMIQCVGSREEPRNYCSRICCLGTLKHALYLKEQNPDLAIYILYRDMMTYGFNETYYTKAREKGVLFIQYTVDAKPEVSLAPDGDTELQVRVFEPIIDQAIIIEADLLVLATGINPKLPVILADAFGADLDQDGFFQEADAKWRPMDALKEGIVACGLAHSPRSIDEAIATAEASAQRCLRTLVQERLPAGKLTAEVRHALCCLCERCIEACPYGARSIDPEEEQVVVNPVMCQGCGACATACPNFASVLNGYSCQQMFDVIDAAISP